ncbi:MAG TPA: DUF6600 domain-containing protein [Thermoanaerobaculia bacterium]
MATLKPRWVPRVRLALGLFALMALPAVAWSDSGSYGYLRVVEGSATLMQAGSGTRTPAEINQPVLVGDHLWVPSRSRVEIVLADGNLVRLDGGSELVLERLAASPDANDRATVLRLLEGNMQLAVLHESLGEELPRIETPNATIYVQDFGIFRISSDQGTWTELVVRRGKAEVVTDRGSDVVRADEQAYIEGDDRTASSDVQAAGSYDSLERWAQRLDDDARTDVRYVDDNLRYSAAPLARHGSWVNYEGDHYWRPRVDAGWRPYWHGRWAYTPSGMTWVSYEPWGWVPYHYGSWDYVPVHGWVWRPGYTYAPAWVYWYWGPSYTGWCPVGYYTRYYGRHSGFGSGFRFGVYGWAGGDWGHYNHWTFVPGSYFRGYRRGYRDGYRDGWKDAGWRDHWDVRRHAVPVDDLRRSRVPMDRGIITTDTKPLKPEILEDPRGVERALRDHPTARRIRGGDGNADLPDVTPFVARKPELPPTVVRSVVGDKDGNQLDGTPLRPSTLGRKDDSGPRVAGRTPEDDKPGYGEPSSRPRIILGDGDRPQSTGSTPETKDGRSPRVVGCPSPSDPGGAPRPGSDSRGDDGGAIRVVPRGEQPTKDVPGRPGVRESSPRGSRPDAKDDGGAPRPDRGGTIRVVPRGEQPTKDAPGRPTVRESSPRSGRPEASDPGGAPRPDRGSRSVTRAVPQERNQTRPETKSPRWIDLGPSGSSEPEPRPSSKDRDRGGYARPETRTDRFPEWRGPEASRPEARQPSVRPERKPYEGARPEPRVAPRVYEPKRSERPSYSPPPSRDRGGYEPRARSAPRNDSPSVRPGGSDRSSRQPSAKPSEGGGSSGRTRSSRPRGDGNKDRQ